MWIMVSGPYTSGAPTPEARLHNLRVMNSAAVELFRRGHVPIIGVNMALPMIDAAGHEHFTALMMPVSLALCERCDAVVRVGGPSVGADEEVDRFRAAGKPVYLSIDQVPGSQ
jgi:hypothetical protein